MKMKNYEEMKTGYLNKINASEKNLLDDTPFVEFQSHIPCLCYVIEMIKMQNGTLPFFSNTTLQIRSMAIYLRKIKGYFFF